MKNPPPPLHLLFQQYLDICNQAIEAHRDEFPYKHIWEAAENLQGNEGLHLTLYDDEPKAEYEVKLRNKHIELVGPTGADATSGWRVNSSYLREVVQNPEKYISDPAKLDWKWLKKRGA